MGLLKDVRFGLRMMAKSPWFTCMAVLTLALGIGINAGGFSIANGVLWKKLPFKDAQEIVTVAMTDGSVSPDEASVSYPEFRDIQSRAHSLKSVAALQSLPLVLSGEGSPAERYSGARVTANLFSFVGINPIRGRNFNAEDEKPGAPKVVLISYDIWQTRYRGREGIVGQIVRVDGEPAAIVGVMPQGVRFPFIERVWIPLVTASNPDQRDNRNLVVFGRLANGVSLDTSRSELAAIGQEFAREYPGTTKGYSAVVLTYLDWANGPETRPILMTIVGAVGFVLLIACANVANLLLSRAVQRSREASIRIALGASRWRIIRQFLIESIMLSLLGGVFGLGIAQGFIRWMSYLLSAADTDMPYWMNFEMDYTLFAYFLFVCIATGIAFGSLPALQISKSNVNDNLKEGGRGAAGGPKARRVTAVLLIGEIALTVILLVGAGLLIRSFMKMNTVNVQVDTQHLIEGRLQLSPAKYPNNSDRITFVESILERLNTPGQSATVANFGPLAGAWFQPLKLRERNVADKNGKLPEVGVLVVANGYFPAIGVTITRGRGFEPSDGLAGQDAGIVAAIVNERFAAKYWPGENPIGKQLRVGGEDRPWLNVVGVSPNVFQTGEIAFGPDPLVYVLYRQNPWARISVLVRGPAVDSATDQLRAEVARMDPDLAVYSVQTVADVLRSELWAQRIFGMLFGLFASVALIIASVGLYGVTAHGVNQRTQEIGIRVALGATPLRVIWLVLKQSAGRVAIGIALGLLFATFLTDAIAFVLVVTPTDPVTFVSISAFLAIVSFIATLIPAWSAARLNPVEALRME